MSDYDPADYNKGGMVAFVFTMVVTLVFFVYLSFFHSGVELNELNLPEDMKAPATVDEAQGPEGGSVETEAAKESGGASLWLNRKEIYRIA